MLSFKAAKLMVLDYLNTLTIPGNKGDRFILQEEYTKEYDIGWVFIFSNEKYINSNDINHMIIGHGPVLIDIHKSILVQFGSAYDIDTYIEHYKETGDVKL